jgi:MFS family permease
VSLLTDAAADMIYPLVPVFLLSLGGGAVALGVLEGVAEAVSAAMKVGVGRATDAWGRRKPLVALGYTISALARPAYAIVATTGQATLVRALDRVGKGMRGPPRDAMIAELVPRHAHGHAFGFHRMMDNLGGVCGPAIAFVLLRVADLPLRTVFALSVVPGLLSAAVVLLFVREPPRRPGAAPAEAPAPRADPADGAAPLAPATRRFLAVFGLFALAGSGDLFLLRRLSDLGLDVALAPVAWVSLQLGKGLTNVPGGLLADRLGRKRVLAIAWALYAATYAGFAVAGSWAAAWALFIVYTVHYGLAEASQRALLAEHVGDRSHGRGYGYLLAIEGAAVLPANVLFGLAYDRLGAPAAFLGAGAIALVASIGLVALVPPAPARP